MHLLGKHVLAISHFEGTLLVLLVLQQTERRSARMLCSHATTLGGFLFKMADKRDLIATMQLQLPD